MNKKQFGRFGARACCMTMLISAMLISAVPVRAESVNALQAVPAEAWASLTIRNVGELDNKLMALAQRLNTPVPMSPLEMLKGQLQLAGINNDAGASMVFMPMMDMANPNNSMAILIPCSDYAAMTANMAVEEAVGGVSRCMLMGTEESYIAQNGGYAILGPKAAGVQAVLAAKSNPTIDSVWTKHQLKRFAKDDATLHLNLKSIVASPMVQAMLPMLAASGSFNPQDLNELDSMAVSLRIDDGGLNVGVYYGAVEGSATAKLIESGKPSTESLLHGLPAGDYMFAAGLHGSKQIFGKYGEGLGGMFCNPMMAMMIEADPTKLQEVGAKASALVANLRDVSFSLNALPDGADGLIGMTKVLTFEGDAKGKCAKVGEIISTLLAGMFTGEDAQDAVKHIKFNAAAETLGGVPVDQLTVAVDKMGGVSKKDYSEMKKIFGAEGILFRMAAIDDKHVAVTFGGGKAYMEDVAGLVKGGGAPLGANEGIKKMGGALPKAKTFEGYFSVDNAIKFATAASKVVNETPPPPFPKVGVPVGIAGAPVGGGGFQTDIAIPMELVIAAKDFAMSMQGGPPPGESAGASQPSDPEGS